MSDIENVYKRVSLNNLSKKHAKFLDWVSYINSVFRAFNSPVVLNNNDMVIVMGLNYFTKLTGIIEEYKATPKKENTLKLLSVFNLVRFSLPLLSSEYRNQFDELGKALTGKLIL